jgi:hypothetical protein
VGGAAADYGTQARGWPATGATASAAKSHPGHGPKGLYWPARQPNRDAGERDVAAMAGRKSACAAGDNAQGLLIDEATARAEAGAHHSSHDRPRTHSRLTRASKAAAALPHAAVVAETET